MSGGSQHNPNGRQSQLGSGWSPLQLQVANLLARVPQAHMASDRGVTWHTPTPPPHLYHVPAPSPPDPVQLVTDPYPIISNCMQVMKGAGNSVSRHTATPPDHYRHTPTPPDNHTMRHTPSPGVKFMPISADMFPLLPGRDKAPRESEYPRGGVDLSVRGANGSPAPPPAPAPATPTAPALSVRDAPTINSLIARAAPHGRAVHARVDALLERLSAAPASPHSVIVHPRHHTPSPPSSNEDSADSCGAPPGSKRKRKPERTIRVPVPAPERAPSPPPPPAENGDAHAPPPPPPHPAHAPPSPSPPPPRRARSGSAETIDDIAAMIAGTDPAPAPPPPPEPDAPATVDKLESVLASPEPHKSPDSSPKSPEKSTEPPPSAAAPRRRSARTSNESTNVPVESPSEAKPAEPEAEARSADPVSASLIEVEKQLESMFAGIDEPGEKPPAAEVAETKQTAKARKRRKSAPAKGEKKASKRTSRASTGDERRKLARRKGAAKKDGSVKDAYAYDSGSNASSSRSRGPYIQIVGPRDSPVSVAVVNAAAGANEEARGDEWRNGLRARGLHASTLGLRYDASTPDASWLCAFCERGPHYSGLGDLFGPYALDMECDEYRSLDEASKRRFASSSGGAEVWFHEACGVWAPGLLAAGARVWGLAPAVCNARAARCGTCTRAGAAISCATRACPAAAHYPCATAWTLRDDFRALCPRHADSQ